MRSDSIGQQTTIEASDAGLKLLDVVHQFVENKTMTGREVAMQGIKALLPADFEPVVGLGACHWTTPRR